jgi:type 1 glutamine amidotransferase
MLSGSAEYESDKSLADWAEELEQTGQVEPTLLKARGTTDLPGLDALSATDVLVIYTRRLTLPEDQIAKIKEYCLAGKPIVGMRTASHAFQNWLDLDRQVFGGNYKGHYGRNVKTKLALTEAGQDHSITEGFEPYESESSLYRNTGLVDDATVLMDGTIPNHTEPVTWVRTFRDGRVFYTSLGGQEDFRQPAFRQLLLAGLGWAADRRLTVMAR